jgi:hypothetical protein
MTWTDDLDPLVPGSDGLAGQGDDEIRLLKTTLVTTWPLLDVEITMGTAGTAPTSADVTALWDSIAALDADALISPYRLGMIVLWNTANGSVPLGWTICDGNNVNGVVVPNMADRFPIGASGTRPDGTGGGADGSALTDADGAHTHTNSDITLAIGNMPSTLGNAISLTMMNSMPDSQDDHDSTTTVARGNQDNTAGSSPSNAGVVSVVGANSTPIVVADVASNGNHTHGLTTVIPAYIAFTYICYVGT